MGLAVAAPIIGAGIDAIASGGSGLFNINQARKNRAFQERMYQRQLEDNRQNWYMMNEYNLPSAQVQRLRDANLNSLLMYSNGASGVTVTSPANGASAPSGAQASADFRTNFGQALLQSALVRAQIENINADTEQKRANAGLSGEQTVNVALQNRLTRELWDCTKAIQYNERDLGFAKIREIDNNIFQSSFMNAEQAATLTLNRYYLMKNYELSAWELGEKYKIAWLDLENNTTNARANWRNSAANMMNAITNRNFSNAQIGFMYSQTMLNWQRYNFLDKFNKLELKMMRKQYEGLKLQNVHMRNELGLQQQQQVNNYLNNYYQYMKNSYYRQYGMDQLPAGKVASEYIPAAKQFNNAFNGWQPNLGFDEFMNLWSVPFK